MGDLTAHMVEHLVLTTVAAPLLALLLRRRASAGWLAVGVVASTTAILVWHAPPMFDAADDDPALHAVEHASFVGTAVLLWWAVWRTDSVAKVLALFVAGLPAIALGAAMTLATTPWYQAELSDQRVAGALMWGAGSVTGLAAAAAAFALWLRGSPTRETTPAHGSSAPHRSADGAA